MKDFFQSMFDGAACTLAAAIGVIGMIIIIVVTLSALFAIATRVYECLTFH
jgi:hypothetical protein